MAYRAQNPVGLLFYRGNSSVSDVAGNPPRLIARQQLGCLLALHDNFLSRKNKTCQ
jgi:hypothetical protein